jgi:Ala-tRNA(Pro) deacylase
MPVRRLQEFLDHERVKYVAIRHSPAYTAQEIAASAHIRGKELAKTVVVKLDDRMALAVLPASYKIDLDLLRSATGARRAELAGEADFIGSFPECELGAMPPFGHLYGMAVYADDRLAEDRDIAFNAGTHSELIRMGYEDFERLEKPKTVHLSAGAPA